MAARLVGSDSLQAARLPRPSFLAIRIAVSDYGMIDKTSLSLSHNGALLLLLYYLMLPDEQASSIICGPSVMHCQGLSASVSISISNPSGGKTVIRTPESLRFVHHGISTFCYLLLCQLVLQTSSADVAG